MRDLKFNVKGQSLKKDLKCNFNNIVAGSSNYYNAVFSMSEDWEGFTCVALFESGNKKSYMPIINGHCMIPDTVLHGKEYYISLIGVKNKTKITTNKVRVGQIVNGG